MWLRFLGNDYTVIGLIVPAIVVAWVVFDGWRRSRDK